MRPNFMRPNFKNVTISNNLLQLTGNRHTFFTLCVDSLDNQWGVDSLMSTSEITKFDYKIGIIPFSQVVETIFPQKATRWHCDQQIITKPLRHLHPNTGPSPGPVLWPYICDHLTTSALAMRVAEISYKRLICCCWPSLLPLPPHPLFPLPLLSHLTSWRTTAASGTRSLSSLVSWR